MIYAINYADDKFEYARKFNTKTAYKKGKVDKVIEYAPADIDNTFIEKNRTIFEYKRGAGLWLWKPYIILKTLEKIETGDYLFYCDAGAFFVNSVNYLIECMEQNLDSIMIFELPLLQRQFTKKETFELMDFMEYNHNQVLAGYILLKKNKESLEFIETWLEYMSDERILSGEYYFNKDNQFEDFVSHREDQSVLSILARKKGLNVYRDPSNFGDRPWEYASRKWSLNEKEYSNSPYPKILISNRKSNPLKYKYKERLKTILNKLNIYTKEYYFNKHNIENR